METTKTRDIESGKDQPGRCMDNGSWPASIVPLHPAVPAYLSENYTWAYLNPRNVRLLDHEWVVATILFANSRRLQRAVFAELKPGMTVLQPASVYGSFSGNLARELGSHGRLDIIDVAPIQVVQCRKKLQNLPRITVQLSDAATFRGGKYDAVCCYFLLHELPQDYRRKVVDNLLAHMAPGGSVIFIDFHKPHWGHPLKPLVRVVYSLLEPFAKDLWSSQIQDFASNPENFTWNQETFFGGMFQKVVARRASGK